MSKLKTVTKAKPRTKTTHKLFEETAAKLVWCTDCCHVVGVHEDSGCTQIVEGPECEDHWVCGCKNVVCIHINAYRKKVKAKAW